MLILFILMFGLFVGWIAHMILGRAQTRNYADDLVAGLVGSFIGGLLLSLLTGNGISLSASGFIGSIIGAMIFIAIRDRMRRANDTPPPRSTRRR